MRDTLFLDAYPFARRAAQVRSAAAISRHNEIEREDLEQEALVSVLASIPRFDRSRASLRTFVERIVATSIASVFRRLRAAKRRKSLDYEPASSVRVLVNVELCVDLQRILRKLGPRERKVARLLIDHNPTQIARRLKISRSAVYRIINRVRKELRNGGFGN